MENFAELCASIEAKLAAVSEDRKVSDKARDEKLAELGAKQVELSKDFAALEQKITARAPATPAKVESLGSKVINSDAFRAFSEGRVRAARIAINTADLAAANPVVMPANGVRYQVPGFSGLGFAAHEVESVIPHIAITGNAVDFLKAGAETNAAAATAEGSAKPYSANEVLTVNAPVRTIAHWIKISKQLAEDAPAVASYINARMAYGVEAAVEAELISGDGTGQHLSGIFNSGNYTAHGLTDTSLTSLDVIRKAALAVRLNGFSPNVVFLNPGDYDDIIGAKDAELRYLIANPTAAQVLPLWGLRPVLSTAITAGEFVVADTFNGCTIFDRQQAEVAMFEQDDDNVQKNLITIRAERRLAFAVEQVGALVGGDLLISESGS